MFNSIYSFLEYTMIMPEAYSSLPYDLLHACICIYSTHNQSALVHLNWFEGHISTNVNILK
jgi:hypothetical protein